MKHRIVYLLCLFISVIPLRAIVIIVHGSFASQAGWQLPEGDFCLALRESNFIKDHVVGSFYWNGGVVYAKILKAAQRLASIILIHQNDKEIILIGHSNGGNVITLATQIVFAAVQDMLCSIQQVDESSLACTNVEKEDNDIVRSLSSFGREDTCYSMLTGENCISCDLFVLPRLLMSRALKKYYQFYALQHSPAMNVRSRFLPRITAIYLLGSPICLKRYRPRMEVVGAIYNLYSKGDFVQKFVGESKIRGISHCYNIEVAFQEKSKRRLVNPSHTRMHHSRVGRWLLKIPDIVNERLMFPSCDNDSNDMKIVFSDQGISVIEQSKMVCLTGLEPVT